MAERFLASDMAVRLTPDGDEGRRRPAQWSTAAHRALEDRTLALMGALASRQVPAVEGGRPGRPWRRPGSGRTRWRRSRCWPGRAGGLRAVLAPAGYGKTTMLHAAAQAAAAETAARWWRWPPRPRRWPSWPGPACEARTIARLRLDLAHGPLAAGTVVVLDEVSQTPTHEVEAVLAAVDACPGGSVWVLGDPRQSQPVGAGGMADYIGRLVTDGSIPSARLTVNRRQVDRADQEALGPAPPRRRCCVPTTAYRARLGARAGHPGRDPPQAMADAVCTDIGRYGAEQVAALVVSHTDAEDVADRVRARLAATGTLTGPAVAGPGWTAEREYRAGDRVLLHARCGPSGSPARQRDYRPRSPSVDSEPGSASASTAAGKP